MRTGKAMFRPLLIVSLAFVGVCIGNLTSIQAIPATNTICGGPVGCQNCWVDGSSICKAGFRCQGIKTDATFYTCVQQLNQNCGTDRNKFGYTGCPATCQDGSGKACNFEVDHCS